MFLRYGLVCVLCVASLLGGCAGKQPASVEAEPRGVEYPWMSMERWYHMHAADVGVAAKNHVDLLFIGDSITEGWPDALMQEFFGQYKTANFGIGGDRTENVLWRLQNGAVGQMNPSVISLLVGVNNFGLRGDTPEEVVAGITAVVEELQRRFPRSKIILHAVFPYKQEAASPEREAVKQVNAEIARLANDPGIVFLDVGPALIMNNGDIAPSVMPDFLHLSDHGYRLWAAELAPVVEEVMTKP